jgi:hypothetical protein
MNDNFSMQSLIRRGTFTLERFPDHLDDHVNIYLGSGRCGACFDVWGLMHNGIDGELQSHGNTTLSHADFYDFAPFGMDDFCPLGRLVFEQVPNGLPCAYQQSFIPWEGKLHTHVHMQDYRYSIDAAFDPWQRDRLCLHVTYDNPSGQMSDLCYRPEPNVAARRFVNMQTEYASQARIKQATSAVTGLVFVRLLADEGPLPNLVCQDNQLSIKIPKGCGCFGIVLVMGNINRETQLRDCLQRGDRSDAILREIATGWEKRFGSSMVDLPDVDVHGLFVRSLYGILASYGPDVRCQAPPMGFSSNCWQRPFPQDLSFIHPVLLRMGHLDIAKAWVEFYHQTLPQMSEYTRRIYQLPGVHWAWEYPKHQRQFLTGVEPGEPNWYEYQLHNAAYPARMAYETSGHLNDKQWDVDIAWPVISESTRFLAAGLVKNHQCRWSMQTKPSSGQDEYGLPGSDNYLCALFATQYCLTIAIRFAQNLGIEHPDCQHWQNILHEGLAFNCLFDHRLGIYGTSSSSPASNIMGKEKHPIQLMPMTLLPQACDPPSLCAYDLRHQLCIESDKQYYYGWSINDIQLASSHMGHGDQMLTEILMMRQAGIVDLNWLQIYESSLPLMPDRKNIVHYQTNAGLFMQAICDAFVSDCFDQLQIRHAVPSSWPNARALNLYHRLGEAISC